MRNTHHRNALRFFFFALAAAAFALMSSNALAQDGVQKFAQLGHCKLESGAVIEDCVIGYRTFGTLNAARDNAVLMPTWLYGTSGDLTQLFGNPDTRIPASKAMILVDTRKYFGIAIDSFGDGVSSSPSNSKTQHGTAFPAFSERDMVEAEYRVMTEVLGLKHLHAVIGLSMGGEQTFAWSILHPDFFDLAVPIIGTPRLTPYDLEVKEIMLVTIYADPAYANGNYSTEPDLKLANLFGSLTVTTPAFRNTRTTRENFRAFVEETEARQPIDANDRVWQLRAVVRHDVIGNRTIAEVARSAHARFLVIVSGKDHLVNPQPALEWAAAIGAPTYVSQAECSHLIMTCDAEGVSSRVRPFLDSGQGY
ncbi:MAG TPA: alpha/beta fold hydrolase [Terracidiphilus sp.]|jgi:homoserine O-acetyltransferase|nr:alpha/beta fold hydrolase [Terracidiphilus sp.]